MTNTKDTFPHDLASCKGCGICGVGRGPTNPFKTDSTQAMRCPTAEYFGFLSQTARGRLYLAREIFDEGLQVSSDFVKAFYTCTLCGMCDELCFQPFTRIIRSVREKIVESGFMSDEIRKMTDDIASVHNPYGISLHPFSHQQRECDKNGILYFAGCACGSAQPEIVSDVMRIFDAVNIKVGGIEERCCGWPLIETGQSSTVKELAIHNIESMRKVGAKRVVFSCPECLVTFKQYYPKILGQDIGLEVLHVSQLFAELLSGKKIKGKRLKDRNLTYHDPCMLARNLMLYDPPRAIINSVSAASYVELPRARSKAWCCGCGFAVRAYPKFAAWTARELITEAKSAHADIIVTANPFCKENLVKVRYNEEPEIRDLAEILAMTIK